MECTITSLYEVAAYTVDSMRILFYQMTKQGLIQKEIKKETYSNSVSLF